MGGTKAGAIGYFGEVGSSCLISMFLNQTGWPSAWRAMWPNLRARGAPAAKSSLVSMTAPLGSSWGFLVAEDFLTVDAVDDFLVAVNFHFDFDPLVGGDVFGGRFDDVLGDKLAVDFEIGAGGADVASGAFAFAFVREELEFDADGEALFEGHALRGLGVNHDAAVEVHVAGGVGHHFTGEFVFHAEDVVGIREIGVEVAEAFVERGILVVCAL